MSRLSQIGHALYQGRMSIDFVGRKWLWYALSGVILLVAVLGLTFRPLNLGIEFKGGVEYKVAVGQGNADQQTAETIRKAVEDGSNAKGTSSLQVNTSGSDAVRVQTGPLSNAQSDQVARTIADAAGVSVKRDVSSQLIGPSWGSQVAKRALEGLAVFVVLVVLAIWAYFREWRMSVAAIVALAHDLLITIGVYALSGFEVTPATVTGVLTILGFSLYDTVVVFDKVRENTKRLASTGQTYAEAANLAINQTLVRSINTSIVALLPVGALLYVGAVTLGSGALKDLALALFVGMAAGAYSSIFIATPLLVQLKERERSASSARTLAEQSSRRPGDRFAEVPAFAEGMPMHDGPGLELEEVDSGETAGPTATPVLARRGGSGATAVSTHPTTSAPAPPAPAAPGASAVSGASGAQPPASPVSPARVTAGERSGSSRPVAGTTSAGRPQPTRKPRSQRGKR